MNKILFAIVAFFVIASSSNAGGWVSINTITKAAFNSTGFYMYGNWAVPSGNGCTNNDAVVLLSNDGNYDKAYALLLTAYTTGKKVKGWSDGCTSHDGKTYNKIRGYKYLEIE